MTGVKHFVPRSLLLLFLLSTPSVAAPRWDEFKAEDCMDLGYRKYSSILRDIPAGTTWEAACQSTPATIKGVHFSAPYKCFSSGFYMWGVFRVADPACPSWNEPFMPGKCDATREKRMYWATLRDIPTGFSFESACMERSATIQGKTFTKPDACVDQRGGFYVDDPACVPSRPEFIARMKQGTGFSVDCLTAAFTSNQAHYHTDGCSNPLTDPASIGYKDFFLQACVLHDYCYTMPWRDDPSGKSKCDNLFLASMKQTCAARYASIPLSDANRDALAVCHIAATSWWSVVATHETAQTAFKNAQAERTTNPLAECRPE